MSVKRYLILLLLVSFCGGGSETTAVEDTTTTSSSSTSTSTSTTTTTTTLYSYNDPNIVLPFFTSELMVPEIVSLNFELSDETIEFELLFKSDISFDYKPDYSDFAKTIHADINIWGCNSDQTPKQCIYDTYAMNPPYGPMRNPFMVHNQFRCNFVNSIESGKPGILSSGCTLNVTQNSYEYYIVSDIYFHLGVFNYEFYPPKNLPADFDHPQSVGYDFFPQRNPVSLWDNSLPFETYTTGCFKNEFMSINLVGWAGIPNYDYFLNRLTDEKYYFKEGELVNYGGCRYMDERILINDEILNVREYLIIGFPYN